MRNNKPASKALRCLYCLLVVFCVGAISVVAQSAAVKQMTRAQLLAKTPNEQIAILSSAQKVTITDLVNAKPAHTQQRLGGIFYLSVSDFNNASAERKLHALSNPDTYVIVAEQNMIPKAKISKEEFNSMSPEKQKSVTESQQFEINK